MNKVSRLAAKVSKMFFVALAVMIVSVQDMFAQAAKGIAGINQATTDLKLYFEQGILLIYGAAAIIGLIGGVKVYQKWTNGDPDTGKVASAWFGGAVFLATITTVLRLIFIN